MDDDKGFHILKFPVQVQIRYGMEKMKNLKKQDGSGYGYMDVDKLGRIRMHFDYASGMGKMIRITPSKYFLFEAIKHHLMIRPIYPYNAHQFWLSDKIFGDLGLPPEEMPPNFIVDYYEDAKKRLEKYMKLDLDKSERALADRQFQQLIKRENLIKIIDAAAGANRITKLY